MKKRLVLVLCVLVISGGSLFARGGRILPVAFTLAISENTAGGGSGIPFRLAGASASTKAGVGSCNSGLEGESNTAFGLNALYYNTESVAGGTQNTAVGVEALYYNTQGAPSGGWGNTAIGSCALHANSPGNRNTAAGADALFANTQGSDNTAMGYRALYDASDGSRNTAVGTKALYQNEFGNDNTAIGVNALGMLCSADAPFYSSNTAVGANAGGDLWEGSYNLYLGADVLGQRDDEEFGAVESNTIRVGLPYDDSADPPKGQNRTFIAGIVENPLGLASDPTPAVVGILPDGQLGTLSASTFQGPQGVPGPAGEGLISGSLLLLTSNVAPAGYTFRGRTQFAMMVEGSRRPVSLTVYVFQKQ